MSDTAVLLQKDLYQVVEPHELTQITEEDPKIPYQYPAPGLFFLQGSIYRISSYSFRGNYSFLTLALCIVTFDHST